MSEASKAVFLSYASQDSEAAKKICEALRSSGIEVWFDQSELVGGDAWDQKIRRQIQDCALFVPIVSAGTEERHEGYFRLEWDLAEQRTHLMARGLPFLLPVVIDKTNEARAVVPERFREVQWFKLAGGEPTPDFVARVQRLISQPRRAHVGVEPKAPVAAIHPTAPDHARYDSLPPRETPRRPVWPGVAAAVAAIAVIAGYFAFRPGGEAGNAKPQTPNAKADPAGAPTSTSAKVPINPKSIAVLPFANMSDDKDASAFFSDGIHEDILTNLALVRDLRVVSRTTVIQYRGSAKSLREIGTELGVAYVLEGSVRRAGNKVRVTGQLIRAATDEHIWAKNYDRDLTDIFAIQAELSQAIAGELNAVLSPQEQQRLNRRPTEDIAAYDLFLRARNLRNGGYRSGPIFRQLEDLLQHAVELDPNFAKASAALAWTHGYQYIFNYDHSDARLAKAKAAIDNAVRLAADDPYVMLERGYYYYFCFRDYGRAAEIFEALIQRQPNDASALYALGNVQRRQGQWGASLESYRRAASLDPLNIDYRYQVAGGATMGRRYDEAAAEGRRLVDQQPEDLWPRWYHAWDAFFRNGDQHDVTAFLGALPSDDPMANYLRKVWAMVRMDEAEALRLDRILNFSTQPDAPSRALQSLSLATLLAAKGNVAAVRDRLRDVPADLKDTLRTQPNNARVWGELARVEALLGQKEEALQHARQAMELEPESSDAYFGVTHRSVLAFVYAWTGEKEQAIAEYARLLRTPVNSSPDAAINVHVMRLAPQYAPLRGDPRFEALLNDPKNNEPLF